MKFLADMGISPKSVDFLRDLGHDAIHLYEEKLIALPDSRIIKKAAAEDRILLTHDLDFGRIIVVSQTKVPSVVIFRLRTMTPSHVNRYLRTILTDYRHALTRGSIVSVTEGQIRVRLLSV